MVLPAISLPPSPAEGSLGDKRRVGLLTVLQLTMPLLPSLRTPAPRMRRLLMHSGSGPGLPLLKHTT